MCSKHTEAISVFSDNGVILESTVTCPECGHAETESMSDACLFFYQSK